MKVVYLNDSDMSHEESEQFFKDAAEWARRQCVSFVDYYVQDVSDVSYTFDFVAEYGFNDPKDALLFELKWKSS